MTEASCMSARLKKNIKRIVKTDKKIKKKTTFMLHGCWRLVRSAPAGSGSEGFAMKQSALAATP